MRVRFVIVAAVLAVLASGCGGSSTPKSASDTTGASNPPVSAAPTTGLPGGSLLNCSKYSGMAARVAATQRDLYTGSAASAQKAIQLIAAELSKLKDGAPGDVASALDDEVSVLNSLVDVRLHPTAANAQQLQALAPKLAVDGRKIAAYIATSCHS